MKSILFNILAIILGWLVGAVVNMAFIQAGYTFFPIEGVDANDMEAIAEVMPTLSFKYFVFPFLAHALGTLVGAVVAGFIAISHRMIFSLLIGGLFLLGGIAACYIIPAPLEFIVIDLVLAYVPMAWLGGRLVLFIFKFRSEKGR